MHTHTQHTVSPFAPENLVARERPGRPVPRQPAHISTSLRMTLSLSWYSMHSDDLYLAEEKSMDEQGNKAANSARGQLNREK